MTRRAAEDLLAGFAAEAQGRVETMKRDLLALEGDTDAVGMQGILERLVSNAHGLAGVARAVGVENVETVAHRLEDLFELLRRGELNAERTVRDDVLRVLDAVDALAREAIADEPSGVDLETIGAMLHDSVRGIVHAPSERPAAPISTPAAGNSARVARSRLEALLAAVGELEAANTAARQRLSELRRMAQEIADLMSAGATVGAEPVDVPPAPGPSSRVVLLVENSQTTRALQRHFLEQAGYEVRAAADGVEAWDLLQSGGIDAVVSDILMPGMDGFELTARIRADAGLRALPVILITAVEAPERRKRSAEVGADAYLVKGSADHQDLVNTIERLT